MQGRDSGKSVTRKNNPSVNAVQLLVKTDLGRCQFPARSLRDFGLRWRTRLAHYLLHLDFAAHQLRQKQIASGAEFLVLLTQIVNLVEHRIDGFLK